MIKSISTSIWISLKTLRLNFVQYLMLVIIFPATYLIVSIASSNGSNSIVDYGVGLFCSMAISIFINMQAASIALSNGIATIEMYATFKVRPICVFLGQSIFHFLLMVPFALALVVFAYCSGSDVNLIAFLGVMLLSFMFLSFTSIALGGLISNPNLASPVINMLYMFIVMITPLYNDANSVSTLGRLLYSVNPFSHYTSLVYSCFSKPVICPTFISVAVIGLITAIFAALSVKRWKNATAVEKLNVLA